ncbi:TatD family hydrolase [Zoogloea sp.]|uniref:TatD family hydrolase n=1 Tax=Zoogloea sp. TaxID=49181 RepID=UPI00262B96BE|nr:TatD family hydrolase [Zoogloea sp.]MDD3353667.1 TatD family hydrolase [Zoogloea sp.]
MLIDTHCHLDAPEFDQDRDGVLQAAREAGVAGFLVPAVDAASFDRVAALAARRDDCCFALGIHPLFVREARPSDLALLKERLKEGRAVAVGEIGLDGFVPDGDLPLQQTYFQAQLRLAVEFDLPVVLHVRRAQDEILKQLRRLRPRGGIAHAFNGSHQQAEAFIGLGFRLGFGGAMTYPGSRRIRALAATLPLDSIVLETDAPDIPPAWGAGRRNDPVNLKRFAAVLAELRGLPVEAVEAATGRNALAALPGLGSLRVREAGPLQGQSGPTDCGQ